MTTRALARVVDLNGIKQRCASSSERCRYLVPFALNFRRILAMRNDACRELAGRAMFPEWRELLERLERTSRATPLLELLAGVADAS